MLAFSRRRNFPASRAARREESESNMTGGANFSRQNRQNLVVSSRVRLAKFAERARAAG